MTKSKLRRIYNASKSANIVPLDPYGETTAALRPEEGLYRFRFSAATEPYNYKEREIIVAEMAEFIESYRADRPGLKCSDVMRW